jgi:predicted N-formylglutamate amidohydrolase
MVDAHPSRLLSEDEPPAVFEEGRERRSAFLIAVDHASPRLPRSLGDLGLTAPDLGRHIAWDIGALGIARAMGALLDAPVIAQNYSRLVIDCNRDPNAASSIPEVSEDTPIPGNQQLTKEAIAARRTEVFEPYHAHLRARLDQRKYRSRPTVLIAQHTMTDVFKGVRREMHAAVLYNRDRRFALRVLDLLRRETGLHIGDNEPYRVSDASDYTIPVHAEAHGLPYVGIEVRQDLVASEDGQTEWAERLARALEAAYEELRPELHR